MNRRWLRAGLIGVLLMIVSVWIGSTAVVYWRLTRDGAHLERLLTAAGLPQLQVTPAMRKFDGLRVEGVIAGSADASKVDSIIANASIGSNVVVVLYYSSNVFQKTYWKDQIRE